MPSSQQVSPGSNGAKDLNNVLPGSALQIIRPTINGCIPFAPLGRPCKGEYHRCIDCGILIYIRPYRLKLTNYGKRCKHCNYKRSCPPLHLASKIYLSLVYSYCSECGFIGKVNIAHSTCPKCGMRRLELIDKRRKICI